MKRILGFFTILILLIFSINATTQNELLRYQFEEHSGTIILDTSGNGFHGIRSSGSWTTNNIFGNYAFKFDGSNDYIDTLTGQELPDKTFISMWIKAHLGDKKEVLFNIKGDIQNYIVYIDYTDNGKIKVQYLDLNQNVNTITLINTTIDNNYHHYIFGKNTEKNSFCAWKDKINVCNENISGGIYSDNSYKTLKIGSDFEDLYYDFDGNIDEFRIFDFILNSTQINELYSNNQITLFNDENNNNNNNNVTSIQNIKIINQTSPNTNMTISNFDNIDVKLNLKASCDLYINNDLKEKFTDVTNFIYPLTDYKNGQYEYMVYCEYIDNDIKYYELSDYISFNIEKPSKTIDFYMYNQNNELLTNFDDLYLSTPCFNSQDFNEYYTSDNLYYIQKLSNGLASFNLSFDGNYEFCLLKGKLNYKDDTFSKNYDLVDISKQTELGNLFVGNETLTYSLKVDDTDLYQVYEPSFWGKTWASLFQLVVGVLIGALIIGIGLMAGVDKLVIVGGLIIAIGMGVSITTFVGAII